MAIQLIDVSKAASSIRQDNRQAHNRLRNQKDIAEADRIFPSNRMLCTSDLQTLEHRAAQPRNDDVCQQAKDVEIEHSPSIGCRLEI